MRNKDSVGTKAHRRVIDAHSVKTRVIYTVLYDGNYNKSVHTLPVGWVSLDMPSVR